MFLGDMYDNENRRKVAESHLKQEVQLMLTNPRDAFRGQSRSPNILPFHMLRIVSYYCEIVTLSLRRAVFQIFDFKNAVTLKTKLEVRRGHGNVTGR